MKPFQSKTVQAVVYLNMRTFALRLRWVYFTFEKIRASGSLTFVARSCVHSAHWACQETCKFFHFWCTLGIRPQNCCQWKVLCFPGHRFINNAVELWDCCACMYRSLPLFDTVLPGLKPHGILSDTGCELYCPTHLSLVLSRWDIKWNRGEYDHYTLLSTHVCLQHADVTAIWSLSSVQGLYFWRFHWNCDCSWDTNDPSIFFV